MTNTEVRAAAYRALKNDIYYELMNITRIAEFVQRNANLYDDGHVEASREVPGELHGQQKRSLKGNLTGA